MRILLSRWAASYCHRGRAMTANELAGVHPEMAIRRCSGIRNRAGSYGNKPLFVALHTFPCLIGARAMLSTGP